MKRIWYFHGIRNKNWICGFWFIGFDTIQLGINIGLYGNVELHVPFGFFIIGRTEAYSSAEFE